MKKKDVAEMNTMEKARTYVTCKGSLECNFDLHNMKDYEVVSYDAQPYSVGLVEITLPNRGTKTYPKRMFGEPFEKQHKKWNDLNA